jgi:hypothetical protein
MEEYAEKETYYFEAETDPRVIEARLILNLPKVKELEAFEARIHRPIPGFWSLETTI